MDISVEENKIIKSTIYNTVFFTSVGGADNVLVRLSLIEEIVKVVNLMCVSFSAKLPQTF